MNPVLIGKPSEPLLKFVITANAQLHKGRYPKAATIKNAFSGKVKLGKFGHQVNLDTHLQTVEIQMRRLLMSRLIRIFTVCLIYFYTIIEL